MTDTVVAEGQVKFRDGKKWKTRWVVVRKPSPVADCLSVLAYKEKKKAKERGGHKDRLSVTLEGIFGVEPGPGYDGVSYTLSILCLSRTLVLGFHSREALHAWDAHVCYSLGEVHRFSVNVEPGTKVESGPASLHLSNDLLALTRGLPPVIIGHWKLSALRRYGAVPNGFVFEGGSRCGYWAGVFFLSCSEGEQISFLFDCVVAGITPCRVPHGVRPSLPDNLSTVPASAEERIKQETSELEKRLSMLSTCSLASSAASTYSCSTSVAGDDRSSISSSSSGQSDTSYGSRLPFWVEPLAKLHLPSETASSSSTLKALTNSDDRLYAAVMGCCAPSSTQLHPRGLHDSGRQSSLDSGIGIATGSSGSFSSCTGSLDMAIQGAGEEFGSMTSLPASTPSAPHSLNPPLSPSQATPFLEHTTAPSFASRCSSQASQRLSDECQNPSLLRLRYDIPRSLLQNRTLRNTSAVNGAPSRQGRHNMVVADWVGSQEQGLTESSTAAKLQRQALVQRSLSWSSETAPPVDNGERSTTQQPLFLGERQCLHGFDNYITPEQWWSARSRGLMMQVGNSSSGPRPSADTPDSLLRVREEHHDCQDVDLSSVPASPHLPVPLGMARPKSACGMFQPKSDVPKAAPWDTGHRYDSSLNYVSIPVIPPTAKANVDLSQPVPQESTLSPVSSPSCPVTEDRSIGYAHINNVVIETAPRMGVEHTQGSQVTQMDSRR
ncbi:protein Dok-7 isoform X1 [Dunckerocampus dactyliophorus]|uniref:protein Dok-7 isoform X1 n=1 Tax=Dunckerocampus dactyliophorus TaxID=161453 RepID=UPI0024054C43|nr:protein Dok-7 isoform X1 [Dunckerocampus dactyliophorus]